MEIHLNQTTLNCVMLFTSLSSIKLRE